MSPGEAGRVELYIGGGGDDLTFLGLGVVVDYARDRAAAGVSARNFPNGRTDAVRRALAAAGGDGAVLVGHSWGGPDAWRTAAWAASRGIPVRALITLDPVGGPLRRRFVGVIACPWLNVTAAPVAPDRSDRLTALRGLSRKPSELPTALATRDVVLLLNHWNVAGMMRLSDAWSWVEALG